MARPSPAISISQFWQLTGSLRLEVRLENSSLSASWFLPFSVALNSIKFLKEFVAVMTVVLHYQAQERAVGVQKS